jgi:hypothetical protein
MPAALNQLGRQNAHGTVIGGKGLVQLRHDSPNARGFFNQIDKKSRLRQIKG